MNPIPYAQRLKLNVSQADNALDLNLALAVAPYFRVSVRDAAGIIGGRLTVVWQWRTIAAHIGVRSGSRTPSLRRFGWRLSKGVCKRPVDG
jgi:serine/threonine-protein kinase HipA